MADGSNCQDWKDARRRLVTIYTMSRCHGLTADYTLAAREHTLLFEMFEVLGALAFLTLDSTKEQFEQIHGQKPGNQNFAWSPVGGQLGTQRCGVRSCPTWNSQNYARRF